MFRILPGFVVSLLLTFPAAADYAAGASAYADGNYATAYREYLDSAGEGDARSQFGLAVMYHMGKGLPKDYAKAREWYVKAAEQGHAKAQNNLGIIYRRGHGVQRNPHEAFTWIWMAAMQRYARAEMNLADLYLRGEGVGKDLVQAYAWLEFAVTDLPGKSRDRAENKRRRIVAQLSDDDRLRAERMARTLRAARQ